VHRADWQRLSRIRLAEAQTLLSASHWSGSYYLAGYAIECGLKSVLARQFRSATIPNKKLVNDLHTHDLAALVRLAGLQASLDAASSADEDLAVNWNVVKDWNEASRYRTWSELEARDIVRAVTDRNHGMMKWIRSVW